MPLTRDWVEAAADLAVTASGGHRTGIACPPKKAVREAASRLFHQPHASSSRAADPRHPRSHQRLGAQRLRAHRCWLFAIAFDQHLSASWPDLVRPPTSCDPHRCQDVDPRDKPGDDGEGAGIAAVEIRIEQRVKRTEALSPLVGESWRGGCERWTDQATAPAPPSLALPHKEGGEWRLILHPIPDRRTPSGPDLKPKAQPTSP